MRHYRIEAYHSGYAVESTYATDDEIADGCAVWSIVSGWETREEAEVVLARMQSADTITTDVCLADACATYGIMCTPDGLGVWRVPAWAKEAWQSEPRTVGSREPRHAALKAAADQHSAL